VSNSQGKARRVGRIPAVVPGRRPADADRPRPHDRVIDLAGWVGEHEALARSRLSPTDGLVRAPGVVAARSRLSADTHAELFEADARTPQMEGADA
jgi:hypothetical protein